ncbi:MAG: hypothetical protein ABFD24_01705 [Anaerolineaceae bacterium]
MGQLNLNVDMVWTLVSLLLTLCVFSYVFGDNAFFRFATALFIGAAAGYFAVVILYQVLLPKLIVPLIQGSTLSLVPLVLSGLLLTKLSPRIGRLGNISMAVLVGSGAAIAIGGAALGTIFNQVRATVNSFGATSAGTGTSILESIFLLIGTVAALVYFNFGARQKQGEAPKRSKISSVLAGIGQFFIAVTLGAVFAGVLSAGLTALVERGDFILRSIMSLAGG